MIFMSMLLSVVAVIGGLYLVVYRTIEILVSRMHNRPDRRLLGISIFREEELNYTGCASPYA